MAKRGVFQASDKIGLAAWLLPELLAAAARRDIPEHTLLQGSRIFAADLQFSQTRLSYQDWRHICQNASRFSGPELAWVSGQALYFQPHPFAYLLRAAPNKRMALRWLCRLRRLFFPFLFAKLKRVSDGWLLSVQPLPGQRLDAGHRFAIEMALAFCHQVLNDKSVTLTGRQELLPYSQGQLIVSPDTYCVYCPDPVLTTHCAKGVTVDYLHQARICRQQALLLPQSISAAEQVYNVLASELPALPTLDQCAAKLAISSSGLKRQLAELDCNFSRLQDKVREDAAVQLLGKEQSNRQLAKALGFSDEHNFRRAFKRWTGMLPSSFRLGS